MAKLSKLGIGALVLGTAAVAGTGVGYYAHQQAQKDSSKSSGEYLRDIYERISTLPGSTGSSWTDFDAFEQAMLSKISSSHKDVKKTVSSMLEDELDIVVSNVKTDINNNNAKVAYIGDQLEQYNSDVSDALDTLDDGIVGSHDLNYYADLISKKVDKTILASTETELNEKIADTKQRISDVSDTLTNDMGSLHGEIVNGLADIKTEFNAKVTSTNAEIAKLKTEVTNLGLSTNTTITALTNNITAFETEVGKIKTEFDDKQKAIDAGMANNLLRFNELQVLFEDMILEVQKLNGTIVDNEVRFTSAIDIIKSDQANTALDVTAIKASIAEIVKDVDKNKDEIGTLKQNIETMNELIINNDEQIKIIKENLVGFESILKAVNVDLDDISDQLLTNIDQYNNNLAKINDLLANFDTIEQEVSTNKEDILRNGRGIDNATEAIANILLDLDQVVLNATENEAKIYEVEEMIKNFESTKGGQMVSEYETQYSNLADDISTKRIYFANPIGDYATIFVTVRLHHDYTLPQTMIIAPEAGKREGVQWFRGNGAVNTILVSVLFIVDYDDNSIRTAAIQFHNVMAWTHGTYSNIRGILSK